MEITCKHPESSHGVPVILNDNKDVMDYAQGLTASLDHLGWTRQQAAIAAGYKSKRSIDKFWQGFPPSAQLLNVLSIELDKSENNNK